MEYYSTIKRNAFKSALMRWLNLKPVIQSEISQKEKQLPLVPKITLHLPYPFTVE